MWIEQLGSETRRCFKLIKQVSLFLSTSFGTHYCERKCLLLILPTIEAASKYLPCQLIPLFLIFYIRRIFQISSFAPWRTSREFLPNTVTWKWQIATDITMQQVPYSLWSFFKDFDLLQTFLTSKNDFSQNENKGYLADPGENAGNKPGWKGNQNEEDFDPWALPELQDLGPKWSGKFRCVQSGCILRLTSSYHKIPKMNPVGVKWF